MARFLHIADLHLGRTLHQVRLLEDQRYALEGILSIIRDAAPKIDAVLIAGDVYDRSVPPAEAVTLLNWFIDEVANTLGVQVVMIPGNHDSAERMGFMAGLTKEVVHIAPPADAHPSPLIIHDEHGPLDIFALPFLDPPLIRSITGDAAVKDQQTAMDAMVERMIAQSTSARRVLVAHAFVNDDLESAEESDSERALYVGGSSVVDAQSLSQFNYVALGHLHRPQTIGSPRIQYAGSLLKYSKSEADHKKSVTLIQIDADGVVATERVPMPIRRDLRVKRGLFETLMAEEDVQPKDYIFFELENRDPISEVMNRLRETYPNAVHLMYVERDVDTALTTPSVQHHEVRIEDHFARFFEQVTGAPLEDDQDAALREVIGELGDELEPPS
jgi:DNA repair protein SbcD/Mre11